MFSGVWGFSLHVQQLPSFPTSLTSGLSLPVSSLPGDPPANEEGIHPGVLPRQKVHVCLLLPSQVPGCCRQQDVCQGQTSECALTPLLPKPEPLSYPCPPIVPWKEDNHL